MGKKPKQITLDLIVKLTMEEKATMAEQLTERINRKDHLEDAKKVASKRYSAQIEETIAEINDLSTKIRSGEELRPVSCEIRYDDPVDGQKSTYRLDTGARISSELMTESEMQEDLFPEDEEGETADGDAEGEDTAAVSEVPEKNADEMLSEHRSGLSGGDADQERQSAGTVSRKRKRKVDGGFGIGSGGGPENRVRMGTERDHRL